MVWRYVWRMDGRVWHFQARDAEHKLVIDVGTVRPQGLGYVAETADVEGIYHQRRQCPTVEGARRWLERAFEKLWGELVDRGRRNRPN